MICKHCGKEHNIHGKRGLCWTCYNTRGIRFLYPVDPRCGKSRIEATEDDDGWHEPTWEEVEAMVAEQYLTLDQCTGDYGCPYCSPRKQEATS